MRSKSKQPGSVKRASAQAGHIGLGPGLINENKPFRVEQRKLPQPLLAQEPDILTLLLVGMERFFYTGIPAGRAPAARP